MQQCLPSCLAKDVLTGVGVLFAANRTRTTAAAVFWRTLGLYLCSGASLHPWIRAFTQCSSCLEPARQQSSDCWGVCRHQHASCLAFIAFTGFR